MKIDLSSVRKSLKALDFETLFREHLGWDNYQAHLSIPVNGNSVSLKAIAQKRGFVAYLCDAIPDRPLRLKIDHQVAKSVREHIIIYADQATGQQVWQWIRREPGKPLACREHRFDTRQSGDALIQRLEALAVSIDEEEQITIVDVTGRARAAFDVDKVTKKFYDRFKAEHTAFLKFIKGIAQKGDLEWYTSLMLNRLMFVYFIQKKGFLDGDTDYLRNRLHRMRELKGKDKFQSFYRSFLLALFHDGLGKSPADRKLDPIIKQLLGHIPYLNGGFFEVHQLETNNPEIDIPDKAFEKLFDFFDQYSWHLDERPLRADNEINPDVVGYIFEKYINQKQMGAYYTKEDITEYISKNTIIPFLFDAAEKKCAIAFKPDSALWRILQDDPDRYIYAAVRHGVIDEKGAIIPLPKDIEAGVKAVAKREGWNKAAPDPFALPTETWREHVARRQRCLEIREKLSKGEVHQINDLISLNLDIWQFARDAIVNAEGPELLRAFWHVITAMTILDPTCGSGAFLFAALCIMETLYSDCLERMTRFIEDADSKSEKANHQKYSDFRDILAQIAKHPSERYFILKSIIINNLFGVDIMEEATEICKLRLFLKLVAQVEKVEQIEPLPDMDFNIRAGNTLVGFASMEQVKKSMQGDMIKLLELPHIEESAEIAARAFQQFRAQQTKHGGKITAEDKQDLRQQLAKLDAELDRFLASEYGVDVSEEQHHGGTGVPPVGKHGQDARATNFEKWKASHQPFHWLVEFYSIIHNGGFDVIIGNPPYVEYKDVKSTYKMLSFKTEECSNLFAFVLERCTTLSNLGTEVGMIVPLSAFSTDRMVPLIDHLKTCSEFLKIANFSWRPGKLFDGVNLQLSILIHKISNKNETIETTRYLMWDSIARSELFSKIQFAEASDARLAGSIPKLGSPEAHSILNKLRQHKNELFRCFTRHSENKIFYRRGGLYWKVFVDFETGSSEEKIIHLLSEIDKYAIIAVLSSDLWWWYFTITSDCRHLGNRDIGTFPFDPSDMNDFGRKELSRLGRSYVKDLKRNAINAVRVYKETNAVECLSFRVNQSKPIIDEIDRVLAAHYGFTDEELDFIINYDIKYRMGGAEDEGEE